ncbi:MAG: hypothetical protein U5S82_02185 [Gammaproteobacteria bacterium]|nr:hypothetical protein [Gammaproteobacteria bacterium]
MSAAIIHLPRTRIADLERTAEGALHLILFPAMVVKSEGIPLTDASTLWTQKGELVLHGVETDQLLAVPLEIAGGSVEADGVRYMDMLPLPFRPAGVVELRLTFAGAAEFVCSAEWATLEMEGNAKYVRHLEQD